MPRRVIDGETIAQVAYGIAEQDGLATVSVRSVASACGVSVGTIYNYYPSMEDLLSTVIERFFANAFQTDDLCRSAEGENYVVFCRRLFECMKSTLKRFRKDWLPQIHALGQSTCTASKAREAGALAHIQNGLVSVLESDKDADLSRLGGGTDVQAICAFTLDNMIAAVRDGHDCEVMFALLGRALYHDDSQEVS